MWPAAPPCLVVNGVCSTARPQRTPWTTVLFTRCSPRTVDGNHRDGLLREGAAGREQHPCWLQMPSARRRG